MLYLTVKVIHIVAVVVWIGALFLLTVVSSSNTMTAAQIKTARRVTEAGIGLTWLAGITLAVLGSWYLATWWQIKLVLVVLVSAIHSIVHRRWQQQAETGVRTHSALPWLLLATTVVVIALAVFKQP